MQPLPSISVVIPALNEEKNLELAVASVKSVVPLYFSQWEILIYDDGSRDRTGAIAERMALFDENIRVFHHSTPRNLGGCYREAIREAAFEHLILVPGDNECDPKGLARVFAAANQADIIVPFVLNPEVRPWIRRLLSRIFSAAVRRLSGCPIRYFNGTVLHQTALLRSLALRNDGFGYQAEILVKLLRRGCSYQEVGVEITQRLSGSSKAFGVKNILQILRFLRGLTFDSTH